MFTVEEFLHLIETIYAGILDQVAWETSIAGLCRAIGGEAAALSLHDARSFAVVDVVHVNVDSAYQRSYDELIKLPDMAGAFRVMTQAAAVGVLTAEDLVAGAPGFERSRFREEWLRPQHVLDMIAAPFAPTPTVAGGLYIGRPRAGSRFGSRHLDALRMMNPHLTRAVHARLRLDGVARAAGAALAALDALREGVVLVDAEAAVVHANRAAEAALGRSDGILASRTVLACDHADDTARLRRLVGEASARLPGRCGGPMAVRRRSGRRPFSVLVAPLRSAPVPTSRRATAMVLVTDPEATVPAPHHMLRTTYGLTAAEARTAASLLHHTRLADVAGSLGVSLATVRTLLQRTFDKTDTHSQAELVRLMLAHRLPAAHSADASPPACASRTSPPP